jgi:NAD-dependent deacetylase
MPVATALAALGLTWTDLEPAARVTKDFAQVLALGGAAFAWWRWLRQRHDRAIDVLERLETRFTDPALTDARSLIEDEGLYADTVPRLRACVLATLAPERQPGPTTEQLLALKGLDGLLRFYVYLYGVHKARQVPAEALRSCYHYWLTFYFHPGRAAFRAYVDSFFPTLSAWLRADEERAARRFPAPRWSRAGRFFDPGRYGWIGTRLEKRRQLRRGVGGRRSPSRILAITGAGISAESGLPTFRGKEGYWRRLNPRRLATLEAFEDDPALVWTWYRERRARIRRSAPNAAHAALVELARHSTEFLLVTQNVDDLHERSEHAGARLSAGQVVHIHGRIFQSRCARSCGFARDDRDEPPGSDGEVPRCPDCGALLRPGVVWFDEENDPGDEARVEEFLSRGRCDVALVIGTAATFDYIRRWALQAALDGGWLIEVNPDPTPLSRFAHHTLRGRAARVLPKLVREAVEQGPLTIG